ncbi:MAG TPA: hypothetical protein VFN70_09550 [Burkholderiales bacterium]|nr:hypothetical protein [Burkholderiales bacterium]
MDRRTVLTKTAKGLMEVTGKTSLLPRDLRNVLSQVDGKATVGDLHQKLDKFSEAKLIDTLGKLVKDGFVREFVSAPASVSPPSQVPIVQEDADLDFTALISKPPSRAEVTAQNSAEADEVSRQVAQARARQDGDARGKAEADARARADADAKAKREADERARRESEAKAKAEADARAKREAEERARRESEAKAKAEAEAKAKREAEERARKEAEAKARAAEAEARARAEAEAKAKREAEERARREAEAKARAEAEAKAKAAADEKARRDAEAHARESAEARAQREAEERERKQAEEAAQRAAEARSRAEAEERARKEAEARVQRDQEERIRRDLEERVRQAEEQSRRDADDRRRREADERARRDAQREAEEKARRDAEERAQREAEEKARRDAEERAHRETAEQARREAEEAARRKDEEERARREAERRARDEEKGRAKAEAEAASRARREERAREKAEAEEKAAARAKEREKDAAVVSARLEKIRSGKGKGGFGKYIGIAALAAVVGGLVYLHFMPLDIAKYEALATQRFGQPVKIGAGNISLIPSPAIRFENVTVGAGKNVRIASVAATPEFGAVFADPPVLRSLEVSGVTLDGAGLAGILFGRSRGTALGIERIQATGVKVVQSGLNLPELDATVSFQVDGAVQKIVVSNPGKTLAAQIEPQSDGRAAVDASIGNAGALLGLPFAVESLSAKGVASAAEFVVTELDAKIFGGSARGKGTLRWSGPLSFDGTLEARGMEAKLLTPILTGTVQGPMAIAAQGETLEKLAAGARLDWSFAVQNGLINGIDLPRTLQSGKSVGGTTKVDEMTGQAVVGDGRAALRNIRIVGGPMQASGAIDIEGGKTLAGRFNADMKTPGASLRATLVVSGTPSQLSVKR